MAGNIKRIINRFLGKSRSEKVREKKVCPTGQRFTKSLSHNEAMLREVFQDCQDVKYKKLIIPAMGMRKALIVYAEGLVSVDNLTRDIILPMQESAKFKEPVKDITALIGVGVTTSYSCLTDLESEILVGKITIFIDGIETAVVIDSKEWPGRGIEEPLQERLIRGPREGFTEVIQVNRGLIRRRLPDPKLKITNFEVGRRTKTKVSVLYIEDVCSLDAVEEVKERIKGIDIDGILDPGALSELISERTITPFPLQLSTERPDKVVGGLLQGKIAVISDGSPFVMLLPVSAAEFFQTPEDYYLHPLFATAGRLLRFLGLLAATTLTAAYTAVIMYHYEMIPTGIVVFIAQSREGLPFSPITEAILLEIAVELMREASIRLPGPVGPTLGIVGALILGQAAVEAKLVSPVLLIIVAVAFLAGSTIPNYEAALAVRYIRFPILLAAGFL